MPFKRLSKEDSQQEPSSRRFKRIDPGDNAQTKAESVVFAGTKGVAKGLEDLSNLFGGEDTFSETLRDVYGADPEKLEELKQQRQRQSHHLMNQNLPSKEGFAENLAERGGRMLPGMLAGPGGVAAKAGQLATGALSGQVAEELDFGPWGQAAAEIVGSVLGGSVSGRLMPRRGTRQDQLVQTARGHGLSDREIAPAIQSERKSGFLSPMSHRGAGTVGRIAESRTALGRIYNNLSNSPAGQQIIDVPERINLLNELSQELNTLPRAVRDLIGRDALDMVKATPNAATLMDFYRDVNYHIGRGNGHLGGVRRILESHLTQHLGDDFRSANELFTNVRRLGIRIRPDLASHFHDFRNAADLSEAILKQDKKGIARAIAEMVSRFSASKLLVSPYFQHIPQKMLNSAMNGNQESAKKILTIMLNKSDEKSEKD